MSKNTDNPARDEQDFDIHALIDRVWGARRTIVKWGIIGGVIGIVIAFTTPKDYRTDVRLAPESVEGRAGGGLSSLAAMAGISLGGNSGSDAVSPDLYPEVVASIPFVVDLFDLDVKPAFSEENMPSGVGERLPLSEYIFDVERESLVGYVVHSPSIIMNKMRKLFSSKGKDTGSADYRPNPYNLTHDEFIMVDQIRGCVNASVDPKTQIITISATMQHPEVCKLVADTVVNRLQEYIIDYRTNKARHDLAYAETLNEEARRDYYAAQQAYADYADRNQGITSRTGRIEEERLQNEASLAFNLYNSTAQRVQMAKAQVQEITPVYTVLQPATVPVLPVGPRRIVTVIICGILGGVFAVCWALFLRTGWSKIRQLIKKW